MPPSQSRSGSREGPSIAFRFAACAIILAISAGLLFTRLGHYALWDDEANTALMGEGVWHTGDTTAQIGPNIVAFRGGINLLGLRDRWQPPGQFYFVAPFVGLFPESGLMARLPFAVAGLACVGVMLFWLCHSTADRRRWLLMGLAIVGNVSFFLYCRQCRYYALSLLLTVAIAHLYLTWNGRWQHTALLAGLFSALLATHYMNYLALCVVLAADHLLWGRKHREVHASQLALLIVPQVLIGAAILSIWNPLQTPWAENSGGNSLANRATLLWWSFRDLNACEFGAGPLLALAPVLYLSSRNVLLIRGTLALVLYVLVISLLSPQRVDVTRQADVRYMIPLIPLCMILVVMVIEHIAAKRVWAALVLGVLVFLTNVFHLTWLTSNQPLVPLRSTLWEFLHELADPPGEPFTPTASWIRKNVPAGESVWVIPDHMTYPLMFHAPSAVYAWQLQDPPHPQFANLPDVHFMGRKAPDYIVAFGPSVQMFANGIPSREPANFVLAARIDTFWKDLYRPELFWRVFRPITGFNPNAEAIYILKKETAAPATDSSPDRAE